MDKNDLLNLITTEKDPEIEPLIQTVVANADLLDDIFKGLLSKNEIYRYNCFKILDQISEKMPQKVYPYWDDLAGQLHSSNAYHRMTGITLLANLVFADKENRFEAIFDEYFGLLDDDKVIVSCYVGRYAWKIAEAKPLLREKVVEALLGIVNTRHRADRKDLISADIIPSLSKMYPDSANKEKIKTYVEMQLDASSPKARKAAKLFLDQYNNM